MSVAQARRFAGGCVRQWQRAQRRRHPLPPAAARAVLFPVPGERQLGGWEFHDEHWVRVIHRFEHRRRLREGRALAVDDNPQAPDKEVRVSARGDSIHADVADRGPQEWIWLHLPPDIHMWRNYRWEFRVRRETDFRELQLGFRYVNFYNRYRFRHEDDYLHFDIVENGEFHNSLHRVPFRMLLGQSYRWSIEVRDQRFVLTIDDAVMLDEIDRHDRFPRGPIAVVFWEDDGTTPIRVAVTDMQVVEI